MKKEELFNNGRLSSIRERAIEDAAQSVKSIRRQNEEEPDNELVRNALKNSEEAVFFLAVNESGDDEKKSRQILLRHGLEDIR